MIVGFGLLCSTIVFILENWYTIARSFKATYKIFECCKNMINITTPMASVLFLCFVFLAAVSAYVYLAISSD